jgi:hypothetical protein
MPTSKSGRIRRQQDDLERAIRRRPRGDEEAVLRAIEDGRHRIAAFAEPFNRAAAAWPMIEVDGARVDPASRVAIKLLDLGGSFFPPPSGGRGLTAWLKREQKTQAQARDLAAAKRAAIVKNGGSMDDDELREEFYRRDPWKKLERVLFDQLWQWEDQSKVLPSLEEYGAILKSLRDLIAPMPTWGWRICRNDACLRSFVPLPGPPEQVTCGETISSRRRSKNRTVGTAISDCHACTKLGALCPEHDDELDAIVGVRRHTRERL